MSKKSDPITLDELRDKSIKTENSIKFGRKMIGGYNKKQVTDYINTLTDNLNKAEESFNSRLEDYASMTTMLKQERDQYGEMYNLCKNSKVEMSAQIESLKKENEDLQSLIIDLRKTSDTGEHLLYYENEIEVEDFDSSNRLKAFQEYEEESIILKEQLSQLKLMVKDLSEELENYAQNHQMDEFQEFERITAENDLLKKQYEDVLQERNAILAENKHLSTENKKLFAELEKINIANSLLREQPPKTTNQDNLLSEYQNKFHQYTQNHQNNIEQISENINIALNLLNTEKQDLAAFLNQLLTKEAPKC